MKTLHGSPTANILQHSFNEIFDAAGRPENSVYRLLKLQAVFSRIN
jgi:hypothetical protein